VRSYRTISPLLGRELPVVSCQWSVKKWNTCKSTDLSSFYWPLTTGNWQLPPQRYLSVALSVGLIGTCVPTAPPWRYQAPCPGTVTGASQFGLSSPGLASGRGRRRRPQLSHSIIHDFMLVVRCFDIRAPAVRLCPPWKRRTRYPRPFPPPRLRGRRSCVMRSCGACCS